MSDVQDGIIDTARHLSEILKLSLCLDDQALHRSDDRLMPGGRATVALAHVGSPREWAENIAADELYHLSHCTRFDHRKCHYAEAAGDEDNDEAPLQTLLFWSEAWREEHGYAIEASKVTIATEVGFLKGSLNWAWTNETHWEDFCRDIADVRTRLENLLSQGIRSERGVPCMYDECRGKRLVRKMVPGRDKHGHKVWRLTNWHCPRCHREWDEDAYLRNVAAAVWKAQREDIDGEVWCSPKYAARQVERPEATVRAWLSKGLLSSACIVVGKRIGFVLLTEVVARDATTKRRTRAA